MVTSMIFLPVAIRMIEQRDSRVARILRDARAAVCGPLRPETPRALPSVRPKQLQVLPSHPTVELANTVESLRQAGCDDARNKAAKDLACIIERGQCDIAELRRYGAIDALVRALEQCDLQSSAVLAVLACLRQCELIPGFASALYTGGSLPVIKLILDNTDSAAVTGACLILIKMLSAEFAHSLLKFDLPSTVLQTLMKFPDNEVVAFGAIGTLSKAAFSSAEVALRVAQADCGPLIGRTFCSHPTFYIQSRALALLAIVSDANSSVVPTFVKKNPTFMSQLTELVLKAAHAPTQLPHGVAESAFRIVLQLSQCEKLSRKYGPELLLGMTECVTSSTICGVSTTICLSSISNLTFFGLWFDDECTADRLIVAFLGILFGSDAEMCVEATRALGNITHHSEGCRACIRHRVPEVLAVLSGHEDERIVYNAVGALINLTNADSSTHRCALDALSSCMSASSEIQELVEKLHQNLKV